MDDFTGIVINIKKTLAPQSEISFMQFLLRHQLQLHKDALYYIFKKDKEHIGFASLADCMTHKSFDIFINPAYQNLEIGRAHV